MVEVDIFEQFIHIANLIPDSLTSIISTHQQDNKRVNDHQETNMDCQVAAKTIRYKRNWE